MITSAYDYCLIGGASDVGQVRKANEDKGIWFDSPNGRIGLVCDGMGGHVGGQVASQTAIQAIQEFLTNNLFDDPNEAISSSITYANQAIINKTLAQPELKGMGSTCVMLLIRDGKVYYGHVGDSRIYVISSRTIRQLSKDHSFVQMLVDARQISKEEAEHHPRKNEITNALGISNMKPPTISRNPIEPEAGTCFLLCSDGLTGMVDDKKIEKVISNRTVSLNHRAKELIDLANEAGGVDNITVQLVEFALGTSDIQAEAPKRKKSAFLYFGITLMIALAAFGVYKYLVPLITQADKKTTQPEKQFKAKTEEKLSGDTIPFEMNQETKRIPTTIDKKYIIIKDSIFIEDGNGKFISVTDVTDENFLIFKWGNNKKINHNQIQVRIETDSIRFIVTFAVTFDIDRKPEQNVKPNTINTKKEKEGNNIPPLTTPLNSGAKASSSENRSKGNPQKESQGG